jgi:hypothetical protein
MEFVLCHTPLCISFEPHVLPVAIASGQRRFRGAVVRAFAYQLLSGRPRSRRLSRRLRVASKGASHDRGSPIRPCPKRTVHRCTKWPLSRPTIIGIALSDALSCNTDSNGTERRVMVVGYARTSTTDQTAGLAAQARDLTPPVPERIFSEQVSSVSWAANGSTHATRPASSC